MGFKENIEFNFSENINFAHEPIEMFCKVIFNKYNDEGKFGKWPVRLYNIKKKENNYKANAKYEAAKAPHERFGEAGNEFTLYYGEKVLGKGKVV